MKIQFKTGGLFVEHLPAGSTGNTAELEVPEGATPMGVMRQLGMPMGENYLVSLNGEVVVINERDRRVLAKNDRLAIMPPLKGGSARQRWRQTHSRGRQAAPITQVSPSLPAATGLPGTVNAVRDFLLESILSEFLTPRENLATS